jgi:hypothetical protein
MRLIEQRPRRIRAIVCMPSYVTVAATFRLFPRGKVGRLHRGPTSETQEIPYPFDDIHTRNESCRSAGCNVITLHSLIEARLSSGREQRCRDCTVA